MGKIESFEIVLNKPQPVYEPGEEVSGQIYFKLSAKTKINSLKLKINGESIVWW